MNSNTSSLLLLTGAAVVMDVGLLAASLSTGASPVAAGAVLGAYHAGYLLADRVARWRPPYIRVTTAFAALTAPAIFVHLGAVASTPAILIMASGIQALRRQLKRTSRPPIALKNQVKFLAMVAAGVAAWSFGFCALGVATAASALLARGGSPVPRPTTEPVCPLEGSIQRLLRATEFAHHAHYFIYCYTFWRLSSTLDSWAVGPLFTVGWLAYFVAESIIGRQLHYSPVIMSIGHMVCAMCLGGMLVSSNVGWLLTMWLLTGIGGGTAYMLANGPQAIGRERAEDWGHVTGTVLGGTLASWSVGLSVAVAAIVALAAAMLFLSLQVFISLPKKGQISAPH